MTKILWYLLLCLCGDGAAGLLCFNCSQNHQQANKCAGDFAPFAQPFDNSRIPVVNCTGDEAVCFVRWWSARAHHAWVVQRGCRRPGAGDRLPRASDLPANFMTCRHERLVDGEYKVCFCSGNWCNLSSEALENNFIIIYFGLLFLSGL